MTSWVNDQRRYQRLARRALAKLPKARIARRGEPAWTLAISFNPSKRRETQNAIIDLAAAVRMKRPRRRYFELPIPARWAEHAIVVTRAGRSLRLMRFFDVQKREMVTRFDVAGA